MNRQYEETEYCTQCSKQCPKEQLGCRKGREFFGVEETEGEGSMEWQGEHGGHKRHGGHGEHDRHGHGRYADHGEHDRHGHGRHGGHGGHDHGRAVEN